MKILAAPDSFKGSLSANQAAGAIKKGFARVFKSAKIRTLPLADGGEGTLSVVLEALRGQLFECEVEGPYGRRIKAPYALLDDGSIFIESASALGLTLTEPCERRIMEASSCGLGELIRDAVEKANPKRVYIGLGGSATNDAGIGMAQALGVKFADKNGCEIERGAKGLFEISDVDASAAVQLMRKTSFVIISDVKNQLCGKNGASFVYGAQKGASSKEIELLDREIARLAVLAENKLKIFTSEKEGAGAAGGLGWAFMTFFGAKMRSGIDFILDIANFDGELRDCDLVVTGEGRIDSQSSEGKVISGVAKRARKAGVPVIAIGGSVEGDTADILEKTGVQAVVSCYTRLRPIDEAMADAANCLEDAAYRAAVLMNIGKNIRER